MNDWIEIKTEDDLPKEENHNLLVVDKDNKKEYHYHFIPSKGMTKYWLKHFSHWKGASNED